MRALVWDAINGNILSGSLHRMEPSDLAALATLDALLQESSVSGAARRLGLSTPAVSHALAKLRERFDDC